MTALLTSAKMDTKWPQIKRATNEHYENKF